MTSITIPEHYGMVVLACAIAPWMLSGAMGGKVMKARKTHDIPYPNLYGSPGFHKAADAFNKVQRGHQNMLEMTSFYVPASLVAGLAHPLAVAAGGLCFCIGSHQYQAGYTKEVALRNKGLGFLKYVGILTSLVVSIKVSISMI